jgi:hypothetical protein
MIALRHGSKCALSLWLFGALLSRACAGPATPAPELDALFQRTNGWIGADAAYSIPLDRRATLWLFGDTLVGEVRDGKRRNAKMINNSIALQPSGGAPQFFYRTNSRGEPAAVFTPPDSTNSFFWPWDGIRTRRGLFLFLMQVRHTDDKSVWGFQVFSAGLAFVSNPDAPPASWEITVTREPWADFSRKPATAYGWSVVKNQNFLYVYGTASNARGATLARVPEEALDDFQQWRFYSDGQWREDPRGASAIFSDTPPEGTVRWVPGLGRFAAVYSPDIYGDVVLRVSDAPVGPWSERRVIYHCPEMNQSKAFYCYAGKAHPELGGPGELIVTYAVNSNNFFDLFNDPALYWPRFLRLKIPFPE